MRLEAHLPSPGSQFEKSRHCCRSFQLPASWRGFRLPARLPLSSFHRAPAHGVASGAQFPASAEISGFRRTGASASRRWVGSTARGNSLRRAALIQASSCLRRAASCVRLYGFRRHQSRGTKTFPAVAPAKSNGRPLAGLLAHNKTLQNLLLPD